MATFVECILECCAAVLRVPQDSVLCLVCPGTVHMNGKFTISIVLLVHVQR